MIGRTVPSRLIRNFPSVILALSPPAMAAVATQPAHDLVRDVVYNELQDREDASFWEYRIVRTTGQTVLVSEQIETARGPIRRLLSRDGRPLDSVQEREENARLAELLKNASDQARVQQQYEQDEARISRLIALMPEAFLYEYDTSQSGNVLRLKFVPNPSFKPPTFEARIFHALSGTLTVNKRQKRLVHLEGRIAERVDFGWGLLGHVEKGGNFEIERTPVSATHWKTALIDVHIEGKAVFFKTIDHDEHEARSGFKRVPSDITLPQAKAMLDRLAAETGTRPTSRPR
jgi:hypothetical protein